MTSHVGRLYSLAGGLLVFFVLWAAIAAHPWRTASAAPDPRLAALAAREQRLHRESLRVKRLLDRRFAAYRVALAKRQRAIARLRAQPAPAPAAAPPVAVSVPRVVTVAPVTASRSS